MLQSSLSIIPVDLLETYVREWKQTGKVAYDQLKDSWLSTQDFSFYTSVSAVFSSRIEGEQIELDSYVKHKRFGGHFKPDYTRKIDDLYFAYLFAQENQLNKKTVLRAHSFITKNILQSNYRGKYRNGQMYVLTPGGKIEYVAASADIVSIEMKKFWTDVGQLLEADLSFIEVFYFAAMLHLVFVKIHPFEDGNGRISRLIEKWFLAKKLDAKAWFIQSEHYYYQLHQTYYQNIRLLGLEYETLDYLQALPFLKMLTESLMAFGDGE